MSTLTQTAAETAAYSQRLGTMKGLDLIADTTTPVPADVATYYAVSYTHLTLPTKRIV